MNIQIKEPNQKDWLGMEGVLLAQKLQAEVKILKDLKIFGVLDLQECPSIGQEHISNINKLLSEMHYPWRVEIAHDLIFLIHISEIKSSTTA